MKSILTFFVFSICLLLFITASSQVSVTRDIKSFGAKGDGKSNDQDAFHKAADFFNSRGGNGRLIISPGTYLVGKQIFTGGKPGMPAYTPEDVLHFVNIKNMKIEGSARSVIKYIDGLRFGAFDPKNGAPYDHGNNLFVNVEYASSLGLCVCIEKSHDVSVTGLTLDGNSDNVILGGIYGDVGRQLAHYGIYIANSYNITIQKMHIHHFALDGICVTNEASVPKNNIRMMDCVFEYNSRQGLSWVGGNELYAKNCKFNFTGRGKFVSSPAAGVDVEAEVGPVRNGVFENCEMIDNAGLAMGADSGDGGYCTFTGCTFWGITSWSIWITKPGFTFTNCNIYGSIVHGYDAPDEKSATKFYNCHFEDKPYKGKEPYGEYLVASDGKKRVTFSNCDFIANKKKLILVITASTKTEEKYQFTDCRFTVKNANYPTGDYVALIRGMVRKNCIFEFKSKDARKKNYFLDDYDHPVNVDLGGNKIIYPKE